MNELRELRRAIGLGQRAFAALLSIPLETYLGIEEADAVTGVVARVEALDRVGMDGRRSPISPRGPAHFLKIASQPEK